MPLSVSRKRLDGTVGLPTTVGVKPVPATFQSGSYSDFLGDPRTYGITLRANF